MEILIFIIVAIVIIAVVVRARSGSKPKDKYYHVRETRVQTRDHIVKVPGNKRKR